MPELPPLELPELPPIEFPEPPEVPLLVEDPLELLPPELAPPVPEELLELPDEGLESPVPSRAVDDEHPPVGARPTTTNSAAFMATPPFPNMVGAQRRPLKRRLIVGPL
jgi:hypothetical protein